MKKIITAFLVMMLPLMMLAQGWPTQYNGVMLQGFYWDSFNETRWPKLESQADELAEFFKLVWIPQSANCGGTSMGYDDLYWFTDYNSSFGTDTQLRSMINVFKSKGIGTIADVVVNHRKTINDWVTFPVEVYNGVTYKMNSTDICRNDDGGSTLTWANQNGKQNHDWVMKNAVYESDTELKFAANGSWDVNWGNVAFPLGIGTQGGDNIKVVAGTYDVIFNDILGEYYFIEK